VQHFDTTSGSVASLIRLLLLTSSSDVVVINERCRGGHPFVTTDYADLMLFITIHSSARAWLLPCLTSPRGQQEEEQEEQEEEGGSSIKTGSESGLPLLATHTDPILCVRLRHSMTLG
jgi:hypothetical protein